MPDKYWYDCTPIKTRSLSGKEIIVYRPLIVVEIRFPLCEPFFTKALVDSGADDCLFAKEIAEARKIPFPSVATGWSRGAGTTRFPIWEHPAELRFQGVKINIRKWTLMRDAKTGRMGHNLLGREDFFRKFRVMFHQHKRKIEIRPIKKKR